jgi:hypothetical protein
LDFGFTGGEQGNGEPDTLESEFADHIKGFVAFLRLQAIDGENEVFDITVIVQESLAVLVSSGEHGLVAIDVDRDSIVGESNLVGVEEFISDVGNGPMAGTTTVPDKGEDIPSNEPTRGSNGQFFERACSARVSRTRAVRAMDELADQFEWSVEGVDGMSAVVADGHVPAALGAGTILRDENLAGELRVFGPTVPHDLPSLDPSTYFSYSSPASRWAACFPPILACFRPIVL